MAGGRHRALLAVAVALSVAPAVLGVAGLAGLRVAMFIVPGGLSGDGFGDLAVGVSHTPDEGSHGLYVVRGPRLAGTLLEGGGGLGEAGARGASVYRILALLPPAIWIPLLALLASLPLAYSLADRRLHGSLAITLTMALLFTVLTVSVSASTLLPANIAPANIAEDIGVPTVSLSAISHKPVEGVAILKYTLKGASLKEVSKCLILEPGSTFKCTARVMPSGEVVVEIPSEAYEHLYRMSAGSISSMRLRLNVTLDKGWASGLFDLSVRWERLRVHAEGWRAVVENPNPIPFTLEDVSIQYISYQGGTPQLVKVERLGDVRVPPGGEASIPVEPGGWVAYVTFRYHYKFAGGGVVEESVRIG